MKTIDEVIEVYDPTGEYNEYAHTDEFTITSSSGQVFDVSVDYAFDGDDISIGDVRDLSTGDTLDIEQSGIDLLDLEGIVWARIQEEIADADISDYT